MNDGYGIPAHGRPGHTPHRPAARFLVVIDAGGVATARLFDADRAALNDFAGGTEEVAQMTQGLSPTHGASGPEWDGALAGHGAAERAAAQVYLLDV